MRSIATCETVESPSLQSAGRGGLDLRWLLTRSHVLVVLRVRSVDMLKVSSCCRRLSSRQLTHSTAAPGGGSNAETRRSSSTAEERDRVENSPDYIEVGELLSRFA